MSSSSSGHRGGAFSGYRGGHHGRGGGIQFYTNSGRSGGSCPSPGCCSFSAPLLPTPSPSECLVPLHRVSCQICNKLGHQALDCYQCMNNKVAFCHHNFKPCMPILVLLIFQLLRLLILVPITMSLMISML